MMRPIKYDGFGNLAEDPTGLHVIMTYRGKTLLGEVLYAETRNGIVWLGVKHFNGEFWPIQPMASEVSALVRTYEPANDSE
jgi:hypothetical protein